jgi:hypothetical protein
VTRVGEHRTRLVAGLALALCLIAGSTPRIVGDGGEYLAQALNFAALNPPPLSRRVMPDLERRVIEIEPALIDWSIERASVAGSDLRRDFLHFWFYALLATPFVWVTNVIGISPLHAFTTLNLLLLGVAVQLALPRIGAPATVLLFASPLVWWLDKAHTEVFTVALLTIAMVSMRERPWWALVASGAAATQNPPVTIVVLLIGAATLLERRRAALGDRRLIAGAAAGLALAALQPIYTYTRHGTPSLLINATQPGFPTAAELAASVFDPSMGLIGNFPAFLMATGLAACWLAVRQPRALLTMPVAVAAGTAIVFLYAFAQTSNPHHGATPSLTRYALWFIPLSIAIWMPWKQVAGAGASRALLATATTSALFSIFAFHPGVPQHSREPTWLASWLWTQHPAWNNPLPEVFSETLLRVEGTTLPVATRGCEKVLIVAREPGAPTWPIPCLPAPLPTRCAVPGTICYANRRGTDYDFVVAPGRKVFPQSIDAAAWPAAAEPHVRRAYLEGEWARLAQQHDGRVHALRSQHGVRVASFGDDRRFLLVLRRTTESAALHFRSAAPLAGTMIDASSGEHLAALTYDGSAEDLWTVPVPASRADLIIVTMQQHPGATTE